MSLSLQKNLLFCEYHDRSHFLKNKSGIKLIFMCFHFVLSVFVGFYGLLQSLVIKNLQKAAYNNVHRSINLNDLEHLFDQMCFPADSHTFTYPIRSLLAF